MRTRSPIRQKLPATVAFDPETGVWPRLLVAEISRPRRRRTKGERDRARPGLHACAHSCSIVCHINHRMEEP